MLISDFVYGDFEIKEPILLDLLESQELKRLRDVSQLGIPTKYYFRNNFSRYEHSVGVMLLLKKLGASTEEQVAGLLHDVSQFSFSHIVDWVFGDGDKGNESYHDFQHKDFVSKTNLPNILAKHNYSLDRILDDNNFPLLENNLPDVCADRLDYSLRELFHNDRSDITRKVLGNVEVRDNTIYFKDVSSARVFADGYMELQQVSWGSIEGITRYAVLSKAFKKAVDIGIIRHDDFWHKTETQLINLLCKSGDQSILKSLNELEKGDFKNKSGKRAYKKFRYVDPMVLVNGKFKCLSSLDRDYKKVIDEAKALNQKGIIV